MNPSEIARRLEARQVRDGQWEARCPGHEDHRESLSIGTGDGGRVLLICHAGCDVNAILAAMHLTTADLFPEKEQRRPKKSKSQIVAAYDYRDEHGVVLYQAVRFEPKDFKQRTPDGRGGWIWKLNGVGRVLYRLPEIIGADESSVVFFVEGEKDADCLAGIGLVATTSSGGATNFDKTPADHVRLVLDGRRVVILPDNDIPGRVYAKNVARCLNGAAASVKVLQLPGLPPKGDVSNWLDGGGTAAELERLASAAPEWGTVHDDDEVSSDGRSSSNATATDLPQIFITTKERDVADQALAALAEERDIYHRGGELVHVITEKDAPKIKAVTTATLRERMAASARWVKRDTEGNVKPAHPAEWAVRASHSRGEWPSLRPLVGISNTPTLRPDGTLLDCPGYDPTTGILYQPFTSYPTVSIYPGPDDVAAAREALQDPFVDFPFKAEADRAAAIAAIMAIVARTAIDGSVPITVGTASTPRTGKGLAIDTISIAATGREPLKITCPASDNDDEWRKMIISHLRDGTTVVCLDNVVGQLGSAPLCAVLTAWPDFTDRLLGQLTNVTAPARTVWLATGNGISLHSDMPGRVLTCHQDANMENPEDRTGFRYPDLKSHVRQRHPHMVHAALTILRAFHVAGRPQHGKPRLGGFEAWDSLIRSACVWAGIGDPDGARERTRIEGDSDKNALRGALMAWENAFGDAPTTMAAACAKAAGDAKAPGDPELASALCEILSGSRTQLNTRTLGYALRRYKGRIAAGRYFDEGTRYEGIRRWLVRCVEPTAPPPNPPPPTPSPPQPPGQAASAPESATVETGADGADGADAPTPVKVKHPLLSSLGLGIGTSSAPSAPPPSVGDSGADRPASAPERPAGQADPAFAAPSWRPAPPDAPQVWHPVPPGWQAKTKWTEPRCPAGRHALTGANVLPGGGCRSCASAAAQRPNGGPNGGRIELTDEVGDWPPPSGYMSAGYINHLAAAAGFWGPLTDDIRPNGHSTPCEAVVVPQAPDVDQAPPAPTEPALGPACGSAAQPSRAPDWTDKLTDGDGWGPTSTRGTP